MGAQPSVVVEIDIKQNIAKAYNPLFPNMVVTLDDELIADARAIINNPGHGSNEIEVVKTMHDMLREEYKAKYGI